MVIVYIIIDWWLDVELLYVGFMWKFRRKFHRRFSSIPNAVYCCAHKNGRPFHVQQDVVRTCNAYELMQVQFYYRLDVSKMISNIDLNCIFNKVRILTYLIQILFENLKYTSRWKNI